MLTSSTLVGLRLSSTPLHASFYTSREEASPTEKTYANTEQKLCTPEELVAVLAA
jgi:hypothetical protein